MKLKWVKKTGGICQSQLTLFFPNVKVEGLEIIGAPDTNEVSITLSYSIINTGITDQLQLIL